MDLTFERRSEVSCPPQVRRPSARAIDLCTAAPRWQNLLWHFHFYLERHCFDIGATHRLILQFMLRCLNINAIFFLRKLYIQMDSNWVCKNNFFFWIHVIMTNQEYTYRNCFCSENVEADEAYNTSQCKHYKQCVFQNGNGLALLYKFYSKHNNLSFKTNLS